MAKKNVNKEHSMPSDSGLNKTSLELIVYQIGEIKQLITNLSGKVDGNQEKIERRVSALEIWQAGEKEKSDASPAVDWQKIILAIIALAGTALTIALGIVQSGLVK